MKKLLIVIFIMVCLFLNSCGFDDTYKISGLENYHPANSEAGTSDGIMPDDFLNKFDYISGDYHFIEENAFSLGKPYLDRSILYLSYDSTVYSDAKQYAMDHMKLSDNIVEEYNGYVFYDNYVDDDFSFPEEFKRFAYNDTNNTLVFIGFFESGVYNCPTDWVTFLEEYYGDWYDFSQ